MLATHWDKRVCRPHQTSNRETVLPGDRRVLMGGTHRFDGTHRLAVRPFRPLREVSQVRDRPHPSPDEAPRGVVAGSAAMRWMTPSEMGFDVLMQMLCDRGVGLFGVALQGQELVAALVPALASAGRLTAHSLDRHPTPFDSE